MHKEFIPAAARIQQIKRQTDDTLTYTLAFEEADLGRTYRFEPGQFNMISLLGIGEAPFSISSWHRQPERFDHTIRAVGGVTNALAKLQEGERVWVRGPYGRGWPLEEMKGRNILLVAGGIGLAPLRPVIREVLQRPTSYGRLEILYGARTDGDYLFRDEFEEWQAAPNITLRLSADRPSEGFIGRVGPVVTLFDEMKSRPVGTVVITCGPEIMMKYVVRGLMTRGFRASQISVSLERRMECGFGQCGHCQIGPFYVCRDGPVFSCAQICDLPEVF